MGGTRLRCYRSSTFWSGATSAEFSPSWELSPVRLAGDLGTMSFCLLTENLPAHCFLCMQYCMHRPRTISCNSHDFGFLLNQLSSTRQARPPILAAALP